jgi:hypothetical protein
MTDPVADIVIETLAMSEAEMRDELRSCIELTREAIHTISALNRQLARANDTNKTLRTALTVATMKITALQGELARCQSSQT